MTYASKILELVKGKPGLTDRQIADAIFGFGSPQQAVNQVCRSLAERGIIVRRARAGSSIGNFLAEAAAPSLPKKPPGSTIPIASVPFDLSAKALELGMLWAASPHRPRLTLEMKAYWDILIDEWVADSEMPLAVRKAGVRGGEVIHKGGRTIILTDNSPAQWSFSSALLGRRYSLDDLKDKIRKAEIPFTFATKRSEISQVRHKGTLSSCGIDLNAKGWKLCHVKPVGLRRRELAENLDIDILKNHFSLLLKPSNHFLVPKVWSGFGEIPEVIAAIGDLELNSRE